MTTAEYLDKLARQQALGLGTTAPLTLETLTELERQAERDRKREIRKRAQALIKTGTVTEWAGRLGMHPRQVRRMRKDGPNLRNAHAILKVAP